MDGAFIESALRKSQLQQKSLSLAKQPVLILIHLARMFN